MNKVIELVLNQEYYPIDRELPFKVTPQALVVLEKSYLYGETPEEMLWRVANAVAKPLEGLLSNAELSAVRFVFYNMMASQDFMPNTPTLTNAGRPLNQMAACFVVPVGDSMHSIFAEAIPSMAMIQRTGGGTGFDFSPLRPEGSEVTSTKGQSSGPISFMHAFDACSQTIKQGGVRRGANMGVLRVDHPDILKFIHAKDEKGVLSNFNLSVGITDEFMGAVEKDEMFCLIHDGHAYDTVKARAIWDELCQCAWERGEPGVLFLDEINRKNTLPGLGPICATNPCGEQPLLPNEACNLASINLMSCFVSEELYDWKKLDVISKLGALFLDCVVDAGTYPLPEIDEMVKSNRKIGLGVMGFADLCFKMRVPYTSNEANLAGLKIMKQITASSHMMSEWLGEWLGLFPNWDKSIFAKSGTSMRNASTTTIAPTGTIALIANTSYGMEPVYALSYTKKLASSGEELDFLNVYLQEFMDECKFEDDLQLSIRQYVTTHGSLQGYPTYGSLRYDDLETMKEVFVTALDIEANDHVRVQAAFQTHTDNAVSKTINFDESVTVAQIAESLRMAYDLECKGVTVYRTGCRDEQPMQIGKQIKGKEGNALETVVTIEKKVRPKCLSGSTDQVDSGCGMMLVTVNKDEYGNIFEVLMKAGSTGGCAAFTDSTARLISIGLRYGVPLEVIIDQLCSVKCDNYRFQVGKNGVLKGKSCSDAVGRLLREKMQAPRTVDDLATEEVEKIMIQAANNVLAAQKDTLTWGDPITPDSITGMCPACGVRLQRVEGCLACSCGYSKC